MYRKISNKGDYLTQIPQGYVTVQELEEIILEMSAGFSFGYTEDGKPGFKEPGGTEYKPFISSVSGEDSLILIIRVKFINLIGNMEDNLILKQQVI